MKFGCNLKTSVYTVEYQCQHSADAEIEADYDYQEDTEQIKN